MFILDPGCWSCCPADEPEILFVIFILQVLKDIKYFTYQTHKPFSFTLRLRVFFKNNKGFKRDKAFPGQWVGIPWGQAKTVNRVKIEPDRFSSRVSLPEK